jgi:hypothetical protein
MFHENRKHAPLRKNHNTITQNLCFSIHDWSRDGRLLLSFNSTRDFALRGRPGVATLRYENNVFAKLGARSAVLVSNSHHTNQHSDIRRGIYYASETFRKPRSDTIFCLG